jgi:hypothetical protein
MPRTVSGTDQLLKNKYDMQEVSDTETIDHEPKNSEEARSASQDVFETIELLENIVSFLPAEKIFNIQRVSKQWKAVIAASPSIEEKMFLRLKTVPKEMYEPHALGWRISALQYHRRPSAFTLVTLNHQLRHDPICSLRRWGLTCPGHESWYSGDQRRSDNATVYSTPTSAIRQAKEPRCASQSVSRRKCVAFLTLIRSIRSKSGSAMSQQSPRAD